MRAAMSSGGEYGNLVSMSGQMSFNAALLPVPHEPSGSGSSEEIYFREY